MKGCDGNFSEKINAMELYEQSFSAFALVGLNSEAAAKSISVYVFQSPRKMLKGNSER